MERMVIVQHTSCRGERCSVLMTTLSQCGPKLSIHCKERAQRYQFLCVRLQKRSVGAVVRSGKPRQAR